jgi:hypothetical protein
VPGDAELAHLSPGAPLGRTPTAPTASPRQDLPTEIRQGAIRVSERRRLYSKSTSTPTYSSDSGAGS